MKILETVNGQFVEKNNIGEWKRENGQWVNYGDYSKQLQKVCVGKIQYFQVISEKCIKKSFDCEVEWEVELKNKDGKSFKAIKTNDNFEDSLNYYKFL